MDSNYILKFGKHKGKALKDVPHAYWRYMYDAKKLSPGLKKYVEENIPDIKHSIEKKSKT
jgi:uncharacterized protein (DUF3820 family)